MKRELRERIPSQRVRHFDVVDPLAASRAIADRRPPFEPDEHEVVAAPFERGVVAGSIAQQRQAEVEAARQCDLTARSRGSAAAFAVENLDIHAVLKQGVGAVARCVDGNRAGFVERIQIEHRAFEASHQSRSKRRLQRHRRG